MNKKQLYSLLNENVTKVDENQLNALEALMQSTLTTNEKFNLTAIKDEESFRELMIYDSLLPLKYVSLENKEILDVGTGAGFPGLPLAIVTNGKFTLLDSTKKKIDYINEYCKISGLCNVLGVSGRAEEYALKHREEYDVVVSRAVADLSILLELCLPFVKVGGYFLALKGNKNEEIEKADKAIGKLGGVVEHVYYDKLPLSEEKRSLVIIKKIKTTNKKYPRRFDQIKSKPL